MVAEWLKRRRLCGPLIAPLVMVSGINLAAAGGARYSCDERINCPE